MKDCGFYSTSQNTHTQTHSEASLPHTVRPDNRLEDYLGNQWFCSGIAVFISNLSQRRYKCLLPLGLALSEIWISQSALVIIQQLCPTGPRATSLSQVQTPISELTARAHMPVLVLLRKQKGVEQQLHRNQKVSSHATIFKIYPYHFSSVKETPKQCTSHTAMLNNNNFKYQ